MKRKLSYLIFYFTLLSSGLIAQSKIGGNGDPVASAILELSTNNKGLLLSRVDLPSPSITNNVLTNYGLPAGDDGPQDGMMVYNTNATASMVFSEGIYVWHTNTWNKLVSGVITDKNIYEGDDSLTSNRIVNTNGKNLTFQSNGGTNNIFRNFAAGLTGASMALQNAGGSIAVPSAINNTTLGTLFFGGNDGTVNYANAASIQSATTSLWNNSNHVSNFIFNTTPNNSITIQERMRIDSNGKVGIKTATPSSNLTVNGSFAAKFNAVNSAVTYNILPDDYYLSFTTPNGIGGVRFPASSAATVGRIYYIKNISSVNLQVFTNEGNFIVTLPPNITGGFINTGASPGTGTIWEQVYLSEQPEITLPLSKLGNATTQNIIDNDNYKQTWSWNGYTTSSMAAFNLYSTSITTGSILKISTSSNAINSTSGLFKVVNTTANTNGNLASFKSNQINTDSISGLYVSNLGNVGIGVDGIHSIALQEKLFIDSGHVRFTQTTPPTASIVSSFGITGISLTNATDSKGLIFIRGNNDKTNFTEVQINFISTSNIAGSIIITPANPSASQCYYAATPNATGFSLKYRAFQDPATGQPAPAFNYVVIH